MLRPDGIVKVVDFGLARFNERRANRMSRCRAQERSLGTAAYMRPEQARGEKPDARGDVFGLGAVLYEMATGTQAFPGRDGSRGARPVLQPGSSSAFELEFGASAEDRRDCLEGRGEGP